MKHLEMRKELNNKTRLEKLRNENPCEFTQEVRRYGTLLKDKNWEDNRGSTREQHFWIDGFVASVAMTNGKLTSHSIAIENKLIYQYIKNDFKPL